MNKIKYYILPDHHSNNDYIDKILTNKLKKFSSERNLFFNNIYNNNSGGNCENNEGGGGGKAGTKVSKSNSFLKGTLKKCKSTRDLFINNNKDKDKEQSKRIQSYNLDDKDRNLLLSDNRKNIVKELRKNFENNIVLNTNNKPLNESNKIDRSSLNIEFTEIEKRDRVVTKIAPIYLNNNNNGPSSLNLNQNLSTSTKSLMPEKFDSLFPHYNTPKSNFICMYNKSFTISSRFVSQHNFYCDYLHDYGKLETNKQQQQQHQQKNNSNYYLCKPKRSESVNQIDLDLLKNELDDIVDPTWMARDQNHRRFNSGSCNNIRKVSYVSFLIMANTLQFELINQLSREGL